MGVVKNPSGEPKYTEAQLTEARIVAVIGFILVAFIILCVFSMIHRWGFEEGRKQCGVLQPPTATDKEIEDGVVPNVD